MPYFIAEHGAQICGKTESRISSAVSAHATKFGNLYTGKAEELLRSGLQDRLRGKVQLILTSPPFPLNKKKQYGNPDPDKYLKWFRKFAPLFL